MECARLIHTVLLSLLEEWWLRQVLTNAQLYKFKLNYEIHSWVFAYDSTDQMKVLPEKPVALVLVLKLFNQIYECLTSFCFKGPAARLNNISFLQFNMKSMFPMWFTMTRPEEVISEISEWILDLKNSWKLQSHLASRIPARIARNSVLSDIRRLNTFA